MKNLKREICLLLVVMFTLCGCGSQKAGVDRNIDAGVATNAVISTESGAETSAGTVTGNSDVASGKASTESTTEQDIITEQKSPTSSYKETEVYQAPEIHEVSFHEEETEGNDRVKLDFSESSYGYFGIQAYSDSRMKIKIDKDDSSYVYDIASDGTTSFLTFQSGDGIYDIKVVENIIDAKYAVIYETEVDVVLNTEFEPFLRASDYVPFTAESACAVKAAEVSAKASTPLEVVNSVFDYICENVTYDDEKAAKTDKLVAPVPDETLAEGKGICFDYASLAAAMLRSRGIPTKVIFGYVSPDNIYHAWNMFYTEETGWVSVSYQVTKDAWNRLDPTFTANGADDTFVGDGTNYADVYYY